VTSTLPELGAHVGEGGKYRVVRKLGEGGMGAVFEAEQALTGKRVALKWMQPGGGAGGELAARFLQEAKAAARVHHPNVVDVYDFGRAGDAAYLVMEYLEGETLGAALARGGLSYGQVIALLLPVLRATASAHKQGVVHRDIKPDNIFLALHEGGIEPKLLDFGISKVAARDGSQSSLTRTGTTMGTPRYMSFEQLAGEKDIDGRADVYAFGVILYEVLTGRPPFEAETFSALVVKMATSAPAPVASLRGDVPPALADVVRWAMERDRDARCPSIEALIGALEPFADTRAEPGSPTVATGPGRSIPAGAGAAREVGPRTDARAPTTSRASLWAAASLLVMVAGAGAAWFARREPGAPSPPVAPAPGPAAEAQEVVSAPGSPVPRGELPAGDPAPSVPSPRTEPGRDAPPRAPADARQRPHAEPRRERSVRDDQPDTVEPTRAAPHAVAPAHPAAHDPAPPQGRPEGPRAAPADPDPGYYVTPDGRRVVRAPTPSESAPGAAAPLGTPSGRPSFPVR
jgi:eukaryotic-like serine/threonine-protein kinase